MLGTPNGKILLMKLTIILLCAMIMEIAIAALEASQSGAILQAMRAFGFRCQVQRFFQAVDLAFDHVDADGPNDATLVQPHFKGFRFRIGDHRHGIRGAALSGDAAAGSDGAARRRLTSGDGTFRARNDATARRKRG